MKTNTTNGTSSSITTDGVLTSLYTTDTLSNSSNTYTTATTNCINSTSSIASSTPSITWTTAQPSVTYGSSNYNGYLNGIYGYFDDKLKVLISILKETEVEELLDKLIERSDDTDNVKLIIKNIISQRHFSEDFLLKYYDYVDESIVKAQHDADIKSQEYDRLALLIEASK